eukprot:gb/GEZN01013910.1/.p1 GENE.gb/GEZN01013910.1/~~gb/GEZN01013910.1/.p1  ORF type:complete len:325 (+),score=37.87 gb/GEZN01013910.1/:98-976(+)
MHDNKFVARCLSYIKQHSDDFGTSARIKGQLAVIETELPHSPLYYTLSALSSTLRLAAMKAETFRSALVNAGYKVSQTHADPEGFKTDAPSCTLYDVLCYSIETGLSNKPSLPESCPGMKILSRAPLPSPPNPAKLFDFTLHPLARFAKVAAFPPNPTKFWGPKAAAKPGNKRKLDETVSSTDISNTDGSLENSRARANQGRRSHKKKQKIQLCSEYVKDDSCLRGDTCDRSHQLPPYFPDKANRQRQARIVARLSASAHPSNSSTSVSTESTTNTTTTTTAALSTTATITE